MTDREALTRAVCLNPDEDTPRLVFADWLAENGDDGDKVRARFIRVQCEMAGTEEQAPRWRKLYAEERKLLGDLNRRKRLWPERLNGRTFGSAGYERGFLAQITVFAKRFLAEADRFYAADPIQTVRFVKLTGRSGSVPTSTLFASPKLAPLRTLDLSGSDLGEIELRYLADAAHLGGLRALVLCENRLTARALERLVASEPLASLAHLDLTKNPQIGDAEADAMAARPEFRRIRSLDMFGSAITAAGVRAIAQSPHAAGLEKLRVGSNDFVGVPPNRGLSVVADHTAIAEAVARSPHLAGLKELDIAWRRMGLAGVEALARSPHLKNLRRLRLAYCNLPPTALRVVTESPNFRRLYALELGLDASRAVRITPDEENALRAALPDAALRFE
jgi:uncharacterized protein (TIGR02996 family)